MAFCFNVAINNPEKLPGTYSLMNRLLLQGTKKYNNLDDIKSIDEISHEIIEATNNSIERNDSNKRMTRYI